MKPKSFVFLDLAFFYIPLILIIVWLGQTFSTIFSTQNLLGSTPLFLFGHIHNLTTITISFTYLFLLFFTNSFLPTYIKTVSNITLIAFSIAVRAFIWSILNLYIGSQTGIVTPIFNFIVIEIFLIILYYFHKKYTILQIHKKFLLITTIVSILSIYFFITSNFFHSWALYEKGLSPDPHNWQWAFQQLSLTLMWLGIVKR